MSRQRGRNQNTSTIDPLTQIRSQSPNLYNPMIQIKYETNNYYPQVPNPGLVEGQTLNPISTSNLNNATISPEGDTLLSPSPGTQGSPNFYPPDLNRVASPVPNKKQIFFTKSPAGRMKRRKSNSFKLKKNQE